jgi:fatty acid desaturase
MPIFIGLLALMALEVLAKYWLVVLALILLCLVWVFVLLPWLAHCKQAASERLRHAQTQRDIHRIRWETTEAMFAAARAGRRR